MEAGFYKLDGTLLYAQQWVRNANYELNAELKDTYTYPVEGWYWFDTLDEACSFFNLNITDYREE
jgi:hypothetical protein